MNAKIAAPLWVLLVGCASSTTPPPQFVRAESALATDRDEPPRDASVEGLIAYAVRNRPELQAGLQRWRAANVSVEAVDEMPPFEVMYGFYASRVETRVGPQRHRLRVSQGIPWPGKADREKDARRQLARVDGERYDAELVEIRWQVLDAYWQVWGAQQEIAWRNEHVLVAQAMVDSIRGRVEVGAATLADVSQAELMLTRTTDAIERARQRYDIAKMRLSRAVGVPRSMLDVDAHEFVLRLADEPDEALGKAAFGHPRVRVIGAQAEAMRAQTRSAGSSRYPDFNVGVEWMETGAALNPATPDSGKDALVGTVGLRIPLWSGEVGARQESLAAQEIALRATERAAMEQVSLELATLLSRMQDNARRIRLYEQTLVPQAEAALASVHGAYEVGQAAVTALLLAQTELLELRLQLTAMRTVHQQHWAALERLAGRPVASKEVP